MESQKGKRILETAKFVCPHCNCSMVVTKENQEIHKVNLNLVSNKHTKEVILVHLVCSNPECGKSILQISINEDPIGINRAVMYGTNSCIFRRRLIPPLNAKSVPACVPLQLANDYREACEIMEASPKAAATLIRRCLQGMIRDFWQVKGNSLADEIKAIRDRIDPDTWEAIDSIRKVGNIGAHMEKDIDLIIDVEPEEAELLINLVESLFDEWYVNREKRRKRNKDIISIRDRKEALRHPDKSPDDS